MPNMKAAISKHNSQVKRNLETEPEPEPGCNCRAGEEQCPLDGKCLTEKVVYRATVNENSGSVNTYTGLTSQTFKARFYSHTNSFKYRDGDNSTTLSTHTWNLKDQNENFDINWEIIDKAQPFNPSTRKCRLCQQEKFYILFDSEGATLNKRSKLYSTCRHRLRDLLNNI